MFNNIDELQSYVQGIDGSLNITELKPSLEQAKLQISGIVPDKILSTLKEDMLDRYKSALGNLAMCKYLPFWSVSRNNTDQKLYKYQFEEIKEQYISIFWGAMDSLLNLLDASNLEEWKTVSIVQDRSKLPIKTAQEFNYYFHIDNSSYFFFKVQFLMRKVWDEHILPRINTIENKEPIKDKINRVFCYHVMAMSVQLFDLTELPRSIRNDITHEFSKEGSIMQVREKLYAILMNEVNTYYVQLEMAAKQQTAAIIPAGNNNSENNKFYGTF